MRGFVQPIVCLLIVCLVSALSSTAQVPAPPTDRNSEKQPAPCTVSGQVLTAAEGSSLKSSRVVLLPENASSHPQGFAANTDSDGRFEIKKVLPGQYRFIASHAKTSGPICRGVRVISCSTVIRRGQSSPDASTPTMASSQRRSGRISQSAFAR